MTRHADFSPSKTGYSQSDAAESGSRLFGSAVIEFARPTGEPWTSLTGHDLAAHSATYHRPAMAIDDDRRLLTDLAESGLTGRGGGHFPVAAKVQSALRAGPGGTVVANGSESEPASAKDRALLWLRPHLVFDGLAALAELTEAADAVLWLHEGDPALHRFLLQALDDRRRSGRDRVRPRLVLAPERYLSGESSAVVRALSGGPALPAFRLVPASSSGIGGRPTLVHNVETLARIALVEKFGPPVRERSLFTVFEAGRARVIEADGRQRVDELIGAVTGSRTPGAGDYQAVLVGGYGGRWVPWADLAGIGTSPAEFAGHGLSAGAGVLLPLRPDECGLWTVAAIARYLADSGARQCGPCLFGLPAIAQVLENLVAGRARERDLTRLRGYQDEVAGRGACRHPDGTVAMVASALQVFAGDVRAHLRTGDCRGTRADAPPGAA